MAEPGATDTATPSTPDHRDQSKQSKQSEQSGQQSYLERWEGRLEKPLLAGAALFLIAYAIPILEPDAPSVVRAFCLSVQLLIWLMYVLDLTVRLVLVRRRIHFLARHWLDVVAVLLPAMRPVAALATVLTRSVLSGHGARLFRGQMTAIAAATTAVIVTVTSLSVLGAERGQPGANIETFWDALWWSLVTVTTVGYGDMYPVTVTGRMVAVVLMITGIALLGVVTATLASWFVDTVGDEDKSQADASMHELIDEVRALRAEVARLGEVKRPSPDAEEVR